MSEHVMSKEAKLKTISNISTKVDGIEDSLRHNIGDDNARYFIIPIREALRKLEEEVNEQNK